MGPEPPNPVYQNLLCVAAASKNLTATELGGKAEGQHGAGCDAMQGINSALLGKAWSTGFLASLPSHAKPKLHATESLLNWALNKSISHSPACPSTLSVTAHWAAISISRGLSFKGSYWHLTVIGADRATVGGCPRGAQIPAGSTPQCCTPSGAPAAGLHAVLMTTTNHWWHSAGFHRVALMFLGETRGSIVSYRETSVISSLQMPTKPLLPHPLPEVQLWKTRLLCSAGIYTELRRTRKRRVLG